MVNLVLLISRFVAVSLLYWCYIEATELKGNGKNLTNSHDYL